MEKIMNSKLIILIVIISIVFIACTTKNDQKNDNSKNEQLLWLSIDKFNNAFKEGNIEQLASMITNNYTHTNTTSKAIDKNTWLTYLSKRKKEIDSGNLIVNTYEMTEKKVTFYNNTAIVTAKVSTSTTRLGKLTENEFRVTNIWILEKTNWKRAGFHDGKIK
ncbi:nuclear transport factor 2 family protein [Aquimarina sp. AD10]|uniref:nuclear transport factor 2 family protein n=2 Tax=Aquimarina sp. AD10 TaxID=1714849 RepID=UPI000E537060|nr:nuclear transport factor 2 family protein [Aquimarina sp. AD10]AXT60237.1 nuclear transport factor 2 family protein [Aquimarina sp. AD10]RKN01327.1 DUF4440 domain-containing protein [Aquimarina sp. AD10]